MAAMQDHALVKIYAELGSCLSISLASARRKVELTASREEVRDLEGRKAIAERLLEAARSRPTEGENTSGSQLDRLLEAVASEENFMVED